MIKVISAFLVTAALIGCASGTVKFDAGNCHNEVTCTFDNETQQVQCTIGVICDTKNLKQ